MRTKRFHVFLLVNLVFILIGLSTIIPNVFLSPLHAGFFNGTASTNPAAPTSLRCGISAYPESYTNGNSYYYNTSRQAYNSRYNIIWVVPTTADDYDLEVYSDASYSALVGRSATATNRAIEWVVFRPSNTQYFYAKIPLTSTGTAAIEWEDSEQLLTTSIPRSNSSLSQTNMIEVYGVNLKTTSKYQINLTVPSTADFNLCLYSLAQGAAANTTSFLLRSIRGVGNNETISWFAPNTTDLFAVLVVWVSGSGTYTLKLEEILTGNGGGNGGPPQTLELWLFPVIEIPVFFGITFGFLGIFHLHKYLKNHTKAKEGN